SRRPIRLRESFVDGRRGGEDEPDELDEKDVCQRVSNGLDDEMMFEARCRDWEDDSTDSRSFPQRDDGQPEKCQPEGAPEDSPRPHGTGNEDDSEKAAPILKSSCQT